MLSGFYQSPRLQHCSAGTKHCGEMMERHEEHKNGFFLWCPQTDQAHLGGEGKGRRTEERRCCHNLSTFSPGQCSLKPQQQHHHRDEALASPAQPSSQGRDLIWTHPQTWVSQPALECAHHPQPAQQPNTFPWEPRQDIPAGTTKS